MRDRPYYDVLHGLLCGYAPKARIFASPSFCGDWQAGSRQQGTAMFHLVGGAGCWLHLPDSTSPQPLAAGDLVFFPRGDQHWLSAAAELRGREDIIPAASPEAQSTDLVCGLVEFGVTSHHLLLEAMPAVVCIPNTCSTSQPALRSLLDLMLAEAQRDDYGGQMVLDKLADALFVMVLRHCLAQHPTAQGVLAALSDTRLQPVLAAMHKDCSLAWQVEQLAALACMSRTAFMRHFKTVLGCPPLEYLARFRMNRAEVLLAQPQLSISEIAAQVGFQSEAAFRHAFKRHTGLAPGQLRGRHAKN